MSENGASYTLIRDLPATDRPRERLRDFGAHVLSDAELIAILLRTGASKESAFAQAQRLLSTFDGLAGLRHAPFAALRNEHGIGEAKAAQIAAALELGVRLTKHGDNSEPPKVLSAPEHVFAMYGAEMSLLDTEHVRVIMLNARNMFISMHESTIGSVHTSHVRIGELLGEALQVKASAIILVHNHPSGDPYPSPADVQITKQLYEACKLMDVDLHDHVIIANGKYASLKTLHLGFPAK